MRHKLTRAPLWWLAVLGFSVGFAFAVLGFFQAADLKSRCFFAALAIWPASGLFGLIREEWKRYRATWRKWTPNEAGDYERPWRQTLGPTEPDP